MQGGGPIQSPAALPASLLGGRQFLSALRQSSSSSTPDIYNMHTFSMPYEAPKDVDAANVFYVSTALEASAARRYTHVKLSLWILDEPHSRDLTVRPLLAESDAVSTPESSDSLLATAAVDPDHVCPLSLQLFINEGSEAISPCALDFQAGPLLPNQRLLHEGLHPVEENGHGRCLLGYFKSSQPIYKVFADMRGPSSPDPDGQAYINHISARLLLPDSNRTEMPSLAPELLEQIFLLSVERTCDWPGCKIHTKQNLSQLAQVNNTWLAVARRLHKTRDSVNKRLIESCSICDYRHSAALPPTLAQAPDPRRFFSLSTIFEGDLATKFDGVQLTIDLYGSDLPVPDMKVSWLGRDPKSPDDEVAVDSGPARSDQLLFPLHLRLDQWGASIEEVTGYSLGTDQTWSSRIAWTGNILFDKPGAWHLGWFKSSKPICIDRDPTSPTHFASRLTLPNPKRTPAKTLPPSILERIFNAAVPQEDEAAAAGGVPGVGRLGFDPTAGWPVLPAPSWSWSQDLKRFAGVAKGWAHVAKKLQQFENTIASISGMTHASCMSFGDSVPDPNYIFAVSCVFEGRAASHFEGASLAICVPDEGVWSSVDIEYIGDTWDGHKVNVTLPPPSPRPQAEKNDQVCQVEHPICPISLCLCTSQDDADAYHVAIRDLPSTRALCRRTINLESGKKQVFFGYFRSSRAFTGSASAAIPIHVVRISLPSPGRKRFSPLPDRVMRRIALGVTELSDSSRRTESWSENLRCMSTISRRFREYASAVAWELAPEEDEEQHLSEPTSSALNSSSASTDTPNT